MRIDGEWLRFNDGESRPVIRGSVVVADGLPVRTVFLIDTGADRTVLTTAVLEELDLPILPSQARVKGVGGLVGVVELDAEIRLTGDGGRQIPFRGRIAAVTDLSSLDVSVVGRDFLNELALIVDARGNVVCLVNLRHGYQITTA